MTLDELFLTYEATAERQKRLMKTVASAMGATFADEEEHVAPTPPTPPSGNPVTFIGPRGEVITPFGYRKVDKIE
jgi:hypothetical protein